ncbi:MAG: hypothetical protein QM784_06515 [Polyangiaceae bacterium]
MSEHPLAALGIQPATSVRPSRAAEQRTSDESKKPQSPPMEHPKAVESERQTLLGISAEELAKAWAAPRSPEDLPIPETVTKETRSSPTFDDSLDVPADAILDDSLAGTASESYRPSPAMAPESTGEHHVAATEPESTSEHHVAATEPESTSEHHVAATEPESTSEYHVAATEPESTSESVVHTETTSTDVTQSETSTPMGAPVEPESPPRSSGSFEDFEASLIATLGPEFQTKVLDLVAQRVAERVAERMLANLSPAPRATPTRSRSAKHAAPVLNEAEPGPKPKSRRRKPKSE